MRLFLLAALTMVAFAANSVLNRWAVGPGHIGAVEFACIRLVAGALALVGLLTLQRGALTWPGIQGRVAGVGLPQSERSRLGADEHVCVLQQG